MLGWKHWKCFDQVNCDSNELQPLISRCEWVLGQPMQSGVCQHLRFLPVLLQKGLLPQGGRAHLWRWGALLHITNTTKHNICLDKFMNQFHMIYFLLVVQTSTSAPRALAIYAPISAWMFPAVTSVLVLSMDTACLQMDALAEVNTPLKMHALTVL